MSKDNGNITILLIVLIIAAIVVAVLVFKGKVPNPVSQLTSKEPTIALQTQYNNPFDDSAQYVNPFNSYKNPLNNLK